MAETKTNKKRNALLAVSAFCLIKIVFVWIAFYQTDYPDSPIIPQGFNQYVAEYAVIHSGGYAVLACICVSGLFFKKLFWPVLILSCAGILLWGYFYPQVIDWYMN